MNIVTRFAPSPTGYLHIGGARTALFNYLFAKHNNGKFLLRIEDTDRERSKPEAVEAILTGLKWMGITWDEEPIYQFARSERHRQVVEELLKLGKAYKCFLSSEELEILREESMQTGKPIVSKWRNAEEKNFPNLPFVIRIKAPREGKTIFEDQVQGKITTENHTLDDIVLLRSDGTPTYMLAVVVDDFDMGITHVIRGDDHLSNTARQITIYNAMNWKVPKFSHIPLIHGPDGKKLSKRHGALGIESYQEMGYLPETLCNYLLRLGWSHGNDEIISKEQAIEWFNIDSIGKSPARLDFKKLDNVNNHYLKISSNQYIMNLLESFLPPINDQSKEYIMLGLNSLKQRASNLLELSINAKIYIMEDKISIASDLKEQIDAEKDLLNLFTTNAANLENWTKDILMEISTKIAEERGGKLAQISKILRYILTGSNASPSVFEIMEIIGKNNSFKRIEDAFKS